MAAANMDAAFVEAVNSVLAPLEAKMQQVEADMVSADKREDYDAAAELSESLSGLKADFKATKQNTLKRLLKESREWLHNESEAQKQALEEEFERHSRERAAEFSKQRAELKGRHAAEEKELKDQIFGLMTKSMKFSKQVLEMYAVVKSLATQKRYREAAEYKKITDAAADKERAKANTDLVSRASGGPEMARLLERHRIESRAFEGRAEAEERSHTDDLAEDLARLKTQFRVAENILRDRYNFNCRAVDKGLDMLNCLPSLPIAATHRMPNVPKDPSWSGTPVSNLKKRQPSARPKRKPRADSRGPGHGLKHTGLGCDWCGAPTAAMDFYIPAGDNRKCGHFCNWECAKAWNQERSPAQFRFVRDLRIDSIAKREVEPAPTGWGKATSHQLPAGSKQEPAPEQAAPEEVRSPAETVMSEELQPGSAGPEEEPVEEEHMMDM